jgi:hypothetical protein
MQTGLGPSPSAFQCALPLGGGALGAAAATLGESVMWALMVLQMLNRHCKPKKKAKKTALVRPRTIIFGFILNPILIILGIPYFM